MAGFCPTEGLEEAARLVVDGGARSADLELGLFTTAGPDAATTYAGLGKVSGGGYAIITLTDATWDDTSPGVKGYVVQTFTAGAGGYTGSIYGYYIATKGTQKLLAVEIDTDNGPYTMGENDTYAVTPSISFLPGTP
jgi:hypothetical protein